MANTVEVKVPDIGNFKGVPVIEILVKPGDTVARDQGLVTLESDKATMEVPASVAGVIKEIRVKLNDVVAEGAVVAIIETSTSAVPHPAQRGEVPKAEGGASAAPAASKSAAPAPTATATAAPASAPQPPTAGERQSAPNGVAESGRKADIECQVAVLGSGRRRCCTRRA